MLSANWPFQPSKIPFFYGWIILLFSTLGILFSIPGQTIGLAVFTDSFIDALDLSERPQNCLARAVVSTVGQLLEYTEEDLLNLTNFGQKSLDELVAKLDELGLSLPTSSDLNSEDRVDA